MEPEVMLGIQATCWTLGDFGALPQDGYAMSAILFQRPTIILVIVFCVHRKRISAIGECFTILVTGNRPRELFSVQRTFPTVPRTLPSINLPSPGINTFGQCCKVRNQDSTYIENIILKLADIQLYLCSLPLAFPLISCALSSVSRTFHLVFRTFHSASRGHCVNRRGGKT
jgi:hypothetical protein